jgi:predicted CXXCH cytochrome family protein
MIIIKKIVTVLSLVIFSMSPLIAQNDYCISCHQDLDDTPSALFMSDVHYKAGISCQDCHGGNKKMEDMDEAMSKAEGFIGVPKGDKISEICASCHSDQLKMKSFNSVVKTGQLEELELSVHSKTSVNGRERILQCITCHNAHGIKKTDNFASPVYPTNIPLTCNKCHGDAGYMRSYNSSLPVDQLMKYRTSTHGVLNKKGNVKAAECVSCHGGHDILSSKDVRSMVYKMNIPATCSKCHSDQEYMKEFKIPTDQYTKFRTSVHGVAVFKNNDLAAPVCNDCHGNHGATPPGIEAISNVCGSCHALNAELFSASPHRMAFEKSKHPECETCHGNHAILTAKDQLLGITSEAVCVNCHSETQNPKGYFAAERMSRVMDSLIFAQTHAADLIHQAEQKGMEIEEAKFMLRDVKQARYEARTIIHSFDEAKYREVTDKGLQTAGYVVSDAESAIDEFYFRRYGLGAAIIIISFLIVMIYLYVKRIEKIQLSEI